MSFCTVNVLLSKICYKILTPVSKNNMNLSFNDYCIKNVKTKV